MAECFCHITCFNKVYLIVFFSCANMILHRWDYCWKCEFDINAKIENYNHHDGEQLLFYKKVQIETQCKKNDVLLVIFILLQEMKNSIFFDKKTSNSIIQHEESCFGWIVTEQVNSKFLLQLQITTFRLHFHKQIVLSQFQSLFGRSIYMHSEKMKAKYMTEDVWKSFFS